MWQGQGRVKRTFNVPFPCQTISAQTLYAPMRATFVVAV